MSRPLEMSYVGLTDPEWYSFLLTQPQLAEVNFWQPHGTRRFAAIPSGSPFFFKLRAPMRGIAGFGYFERFEILSAREAWEAFGVLNGAPGYEAMMDRIRRLRHDAATFSGDEKIGCIMIAAPMMFPEPDWVAPPSDWPTSGIQQGKRYALESEEGRRLLRQCIERAALRSPEWNADVSTVSPERFGEPVLVRPRKGQALFKFAVHEAYGNACAVTMEHSYPVLEAAHIKPYAEGGEHSLENGLLLRSDVHRLFDAGYVTITPRLTFRVSERLRSEWNNGATYYALDGRQIASPRRGFAPPRRELLEWHSEVRFKR